MKNSKFKIQNSKFKIISTLFELKTQAKRLLCIGLISGVVLYTSCKKNQVTPDDSINQAKQMNATESMTRLIRKLENPYSVTNMQIAYENLKKSNAKIATDGIEITTSHLYIKFKPKTNQELEILKDDTTLVLYSYPMDYEISEGSYYHDPSILDSLPTYQYCAVPFDKKLPNSVEYEILENLYIPDENKDGTNLNQRKASKESITALVDEALRITGNIEPKSSNAKLTAKDWRPAGSIKVWDDVISDWRGVEGVIVKARRWFTTHQGMVDAAGNYSCNGTFNGEANYSLDWERYDFALREGWLDGANINGEKQRGNWDRSLKGDKHAFFAKVFMGAYRYYYKDINGLKRPPQNALLKSQIHIRCFDEEGRAFFNKNNRFLGLGNPIKMYSKEKNVAGVVVNANTERLFNTIIHELAHASHWELRKNQWNSGTDDRLIESWAMGVAWNLTRKVYPYHNDYAYMTFSDMKDANFGNYEYTPVIIDLLDSENQGGCCSKIYPIDVITGYSIKNIEDVLKDCKSLSDLRDKLKSNYQITNQSQLDSFFNQYINL